MKNFKQLFLFLVIILVGGTGGYYYRGSGGDAEIPAGVVRLLKCFVSIGIIACAYIYIAYIICLFNQSLHELNSVGTNSIDSNSVMNHFDELHHHTILMNSLESFLK